MTEKGLPKWLVILRSFWKAPRSQNQFDHRLYLTDDYETSLRSIIYWRYRKSSPGELLLELGEERRRCQTRIERVERKRSRWIFFAPRDHGMESPFILLLDLPQVLSWYMIQYGGWTSKEVFFTGAARLFNTLWKSESDRMLIFPLIKSRKQENM